MFCCATDFSCCISILAVVNISSKYKWQYIFFICRPSVAMNPVNATDVKEVEPDFFKAAVFFRILDDAMKDDKESLIEKVRGIYCFKVSKEGKVGIWVINAKTGKGKVEFNGKGKSLIYFFLANSF